MGNHEAIEGTEDEAMDLVTQVGVELEGNDELAPGTTLLHGQYTIESFLNAGGFGITYRARDSLDRKVVIKECFPGAFCRRSRAIVQARSRAHQAEFASIVRLFVAEARSLSKLEHPGIVGVHQVFEENDTAYMALDFVEGRDLLEILEDADSALTPAQISDMLRAVLDAIAFVHAQDVLHRDISPDNILVTPEGKPVLIDFGAARQQPKSDGKIMSALRVVKDGYSPQEFYVAGAAQGPESDLYALGASFYHLIAGELAPDSQRRLSAIATGEADPYTPLSGRFPDHDARVLATIDRAMAVLPRDRMPSATEWLAELDAAAPRRFSRKVTPIAAPAAAPAPSRGKGLLVAGVAVIALVAGGALVATQTGLLGGTEAVTDAETTSAPSQAPVRAAAPEAEAPTETPAETAAAPAPEQAPEQTVAQAPDRAPDQAAPEPAEPARAPITGPATVPSAAAVARLALLEAPETYTSPRPAPRPAPVAQATPRPQADPADRDARALAALAPAAPDRLSAAPEAAVATPQEVRTTSPWAAVAAIEAPEFGAEILPEPEPEPEPIIEIVAPEPEPEATDPTAPKIVSAPAAAPTEPAAPVEPAAPAGLAGGWSVKLPYHDLRLDAERRTNVVAVDGVLVRDRAEFDMALAVIHDDIAEVTELELRLGLGSRGGEATLEQVAVLPVTHTVTLPDGPSFVSIWEDGAWTTRVSFVPAASDIELEVGDTILGALSTGRPLEGPTDLRALLEAAGDGGAEQVQLAVLRDGANWIAPVPVPDPSR